MNIREADILNELLRCPFENQRQLAEKTGHSLGIVNRSMRSLTENGYLNKDGQPTEKARGYAGERSPKNAVILAAGFAARMVPINTDTPKALLEIDGAPLIERQIQQLHEVGIKDITIVVGYLKEQFDYLIDQYGVALVVNSRYAEKNNLHSLRKVIDCVSNTYIIPCDIWCRSNPFRRNELYSWYMMSEEQDRDSTFRVNRKMEIVSIGTKETGDKMIGIAYITKDDAAALRQNVETLCADHRYDNDYWESALLDEDHMRIPARIVSENDAVEINTYEQLRDLDSHSNQLHHEVIQTIAGVFRAEEKEIKNIVVLKKGMTNRSFSFSYQGRKYIMRIPGEGTDQLINRRQEAEVYRLLEGRGICDRVIYIDPDKGYKITSMLENARVCDAENETDLIACVRKLRDFHRLGLKVGHEFDLFRQIAFYESLWGKAPSAYRDYANTKKQVYSLKAYIDEHAEPFVLTHIDAVPDNFLFSGDDLYLIDWEYAGMQDPHVDIAMFCIYALYGRAQIDHFIDLYFENSCPEATRVKIYCYIAACGLLWSNWCEYKRALGVEFGEYSLRQYRYAKDYSRLALAEMEKLK